MHNTKNPQRYFAPVVLALAAGLAAAEGQQVRRPAITPDCAAFNAAKSRADALFQQYCTDDLRCGDHTAEVTAAFRKAQIAFDNLSWSPQFRQLILRPGEPPGTVGNCHKHSQAFFTYLRGMLSEGARQFGEASDAFTDCGMSAGNPPDTETQGLCVQQQALLQCVVHPGSTACPRTGGVRDAEISTTVSVFPASVSSVLSSDTLAQDENGERPKIRGAVRPKTEPRAKTNSATVKTSLPTQASAERLRQSMTPEELSDLRRAMEWRHVSVVPKN